MTDIRGAKDNLCAVIDNIFYGDPIDKDELNDVLIDALEVIETLEERQRAVYSNVMQWIENTTEELTND